MRIYGCAIALELAAQALALAFEDIDSRRTAVWEPSSFRAVFAAAMLGSGWKLSDHIAPLGPLPQDAARISICRGAITLRLDFIPVMQVKIWVGSQRMLMTDRGTFMALAGCVLSDKPLPRSANERFDIGKFCYDLTPLRFELDTSQLRDLALALEAFLDSPISTRWRDRVSLTLGWA